MEQWLHAVEGGEGCEGGPFRSIGESPLLGASGASGGGQALENLASALERSAREAQGALDLLEAKAKENEEKGERMKSSQAR